VESPQLLYPSSETAGGKKKGAPKGQLQPAKELSALKPGDTLASDAAPQIAGSGFTLSCTVETAQMNAVLVAHGGVAAGYALHLREGHVVFTVRYGAGEAFTEITSPGVITGSTRITARLAKDRTMTLSVNGEVVATTQSRSLVGRQPQENFCVGYDDARPVAAYYAKGRFDGKMEGLKITTE
jgi:hypothetical protein